MTTLSLIQLQNVSFAYAGVPLFDQVDLSVAEGDRICLMGRNGAGKSTLMKILTEEIKIDSGSMIRKQGLKWAFMPQVIPGDWQGDVYELVASGLGKRGELLMRHHQLSQLVEENHDPQTLKKFEETCHELDRSNGWNLHNTVDATLALTSLNGLDRFENLSSGSKRRVLLARSIIDAPDILLLDEPTNHLDIPSILWLEQFLLKFRGAILFVSHDRAFIQQLATSIVELERRKIKTWNCDYKSFIQRKKAELASLEKSAMEFDKKLAQEEVWIRTGIQARRTRNEGRVRALEQMRLDRKNRVANPGQVRIITQKSNLSGRKVVDAHGISITMGDKKLVSDLTVLILRGDRIGIIGPNGAGKTTLVNVLMGQRMPDKGTLKMGTEIEMAYFDQVHEQLSKDETVFFNINQGSESVEINGKSKHVLGYLQDFLFSPDQARGSVSSLSGGERNRLLLAKLFTRPFNFLIMDEPTNDLDLETLELLEEVLLDYQGTLIIVSHDREFLNRVVTSTIAFDEDGVVREYVGGYDDWCKQKPVVVKIAATENKPKGDSFREKDKQEKILMRKIESLEIEQTKIHDAMLDPGFYQGEARHISEVTQKLKRIETEIAVLYDKWNLLGH